MEWRTFLEVTFGDSELSHIPLKATSFGLLVLALVFAWLPHHQDYFGLWNTSVSFTPDFLSGILAIAIVTPLYARRIIPYPHHSINGILFLVVNLALTATFIQIILGKGGPAGTFPSVAVIACAIALSWFGMRAAASVAWLVLLGYSVITSLYANYTWGLAGFGFVASGFAGLLLQTQLNPSELMQEIVSEYSRMKAEYKLPDSERI
jgi:hypothetical protein